MLDLNQIANQYPPHLRKRLRDILREYLQYQILAIIFGSKFAPKIAFLGGTALRIIHNNQRFSEDLDFDNLGLTQQDCLDMGQLIKQQLQLRGLLVEIKVVSHQAYHIKVRLPKLLHDLRLSPFAEEKLLIYIDFAPQHFSYQSQASVINKFGCQATLNCVPADILLAQKFYTAFNRRRILGRDFFDIVFLCSLSVRPNFNYLKQKLDIENLGQLKQYILEQLKGLDMTTLAADVRPFLFYTDDVKKITDFQEFVTQGDYFNH